MFSNVRLFELPRTVASQAPLSMGFSRQEYWSGLPFPPSGDLPDPGIEPTCPVSPALPGWFSTAWAIREAPMGRLKAKAKVAQSCPILCDPMDCSPPGSSLHGIFQLRILEWVAISFSRGSSQPRDLTWASCIIRGFLTAEPPGKPFYCVIAGHNVSTIANIQLTLNKFLLNNLFSLLLHIWKSYLSSEESPMYS